LGFGECEIRVAGIYERGGVYIYNPPQRKEGGWGWKNIQRLAKIESRDAAARDFSVAPSCVWWQVVGDLFAGGLYVIFKNERIDERWVEADVWFYVCLLRKSDKNGSYMCTRLTMYRKGVYIRLLAPLFL